MYNEDLLINILKDGVVPALGCTEPMAVAYAVAKAKELLEEQVMELNISVDKNIFKNGKEVGIPGTNNKGIIMAAALAIVVGKSEYKLQVIKDLAVDDIQKALDLIEQNIIHLNLREEITGLYIEVEAKGKSNTSRVVSRNSHLMVNVFHNSMKKRFPKLV